MKARAWVKAVAKSSLLSPKAALRKPSAFKTSKPATTDLHTPSITPISLQMLTTLTHVVRFLDENHYEEEGLYRKRGVRLESTELLSACRENQLPNLSLYNPHSITSVLKQILAEDFEPLIPAVISEHMVDAVPTGRVNEQAEHTIVEKFKQVRSTTREFLQVFLGHLRHLSVSGPCRMSATNLALHIGVALIRPTVDPKALTSKAIMRRRKAVAEFLIDRAASLPYDCATEMHLPAIPDKVAAPKVIENIADELSEGSPPSPKQLHFVQVTWTPRENSFTTEELETMFGEFGNVVNFGVNDQGSRAIVAYESAEGVEAAEAARIPGVRVRRRKPRQSKQPFDSSDFKSGRLFLNVKGPGGAEDTGLERSPRSMVYAKTLTRNPADRVFSTGRIVENAAPSTEPTEHVLLPTLRKSEASLNESVSSEVKVETKERETEDGVVVVEDIEYDPVHAEKHTVPATDVETPPHEPVSDDDDIVVIAERADSLTRKHAHNNHMPSIAKPDRPFPDEKCGGGANAPPSSLTEGEIGTSAVVPVPQATCPDNEDLLDSRHVKPKDKMASSEPNMLTGSLVEDSDGERDVGCTDIQESTSPKTTSTAIDREFSQQHDGAVHALSRRATLRDDSLVPERPNCPPKVPSMAQVTGLEKHKIVHQDSQQAQSKPLHHERPDAQHDETQTPALVCVDKATETLESGELGAQVDLAISTGKEPEVPVYVEALRAKLRDMHKILSTSTSALSAASPPSELECAILQLHTQILRMATDCLILADPEASIEADDRDSGSTSNDDFLHFLEIQSKTQLKILQVEIRAGQELLRLHKSQHEKEREQLEEEITALRVGRSEAERLCADLRATLRNCRSELACHAANATAIKREKSALEEKLVDSETQRQAKEVELVKLQAKCEEMHRVAADAQIRVEKFKQGVGDSTPTAVQSNQSEREAPWVHLSTASTESRSNASSRVSCLPQTTKFFRDHQGRTTLQTAELPREEWFSSPTHAERPSNVAALEVIKKKMALDIREQIATTKAALQEMELCSASGKTLEEEEEELREIQCQLASATSEMDSAMEESRNKLQELLVPNSIVAPSVNDDNDGSQPSDQSPSIFDATTLVNELLARAEANSMPLEWSYSSARSQSNAEDNLAARVQPYTASNHGAQSVLYQRWNAGRTQKLEQVRNHCDQQSVHLAQHSMQVFRQTLDRIRNEQQEQQITYSK